MSAFTNACCLTVVTVEVENHPTVVEREWEDLGGGRNSFLLQDTQTNTQHTLTTVSPIVYSYLYSQMQDKEMTKKFKLQWTRPIHKKHTLNTVSGIFFYLYSQVCGIPS